MRHLRYSATRLLSGLLLLTLSAASASAQDNATIRLESLDKLAAKATEVDRRSEQTKDGSGMVYVRAFEFREAGAYGEVDLQEVRAQLQAPGWSRLVKVKDGEGKAGENETVEVYAFGKSEDSDSISGMTVIVTEPKELVVVNIVGKGDINSLMKHASELGSVK